MPGGLTLGFAMHLVVFCFFFIFSVLCAARYIKLALCQLLSARQYTV